MKVCTLTRLSSLAPEIYPNVLLIGDVFYTERVFLYRHSPTEHMVIFRLHPSGILGPRKKILFSIIILRCMSIYNIYYLK